MTKRNQLMFSSNFAFPMINELNKCIKKERKIN